MMKKIVLIILMLLGLQCSESFSTNSGIESRLTGILLIEIGDYFGSGIAYGSESGSIYIITAKHLIIDPNTNKYRDTKVKVSWYSYDVVNDFPSSFVFNINEIINKDYILKNDSLDIIAILIAHDIVKKGDLRPIVYEPYIKEKKIQRQIKIFSKKYITTLDNYHLGDDAIMLGYPKTLGLKEVPQYNFNRPLVSKGCISGKDLNLRTIIIDCSSYGGNSGGPVFVKETKLIQQGIVFNYNLIGIVTQFIPQLHKTSNGFEILNSGYTVVIPIEDAISLIGTN